MEDGTQKSAAAPASAGLSRPLRQLELKLINGSIVDVPTPAYVLGVFDNVNPTGTARAVDAVLGGTLSQLVQDRMFGSRMGEIFIMPTPRQRTLAEMVVFIGLGPLDGFTPKVLELVAENLARVVATARIHTFTTVPIGTNAGLRVAESLAGFATGFIRGLEHADLDHEFRSLQVCEIDQQRYADLVAAVGKAQADGFFKGKGIDLVVREGRPVQSIAGTQEDRGAAPKDEPRRLDPLYLQVRSRPDVASGESLLEYCVLTADSDASIEPVSYLLTYDKRVEAGARLDGAKSIDAELGRGLAAIYVPEKTREIMRGQLEARPDQHVVVIHDQGSSGIPWEVLYFGEKCPAIGGGISRKYILPAQPAGGRSNLPPRTVLRMLVIADPTEDLLGAEEEGNMLVDLFGKQNGEVTVVAKKEATRRRVLDLLQSTEFDILHYAGHADFEEKDPARSGVELADGRLTAADLSNAVISPQLVFLNACESARVRQRRGKPEQRTLRERLFDDLKESVSLAELILRGGVRNFIGTYWPVNDKAALEFSRTFYGGLLAGNELAPALLMGRESAKSVHRKDWANYLHFGNPSYRLRRPG